MHIRPGCRGQIRVRRLPRPGSLHSSDSKTGNRTEDLTLALSPPVSYILTRGISQNPIQSSVEVLKTLLKELFNSRRFREAPAKNCQIQPRSAAENPGLSWCVA
jgi:hypothetical protein